MSECVFCDIAAGRIPADKVYEDEQIVVFKDINPKAEVHLLMVPRLHFAGLNELEPVHDGLIVHMMHLLPILAREQGLSDGFRTIINTGAGAGQEVFHLHLHILGGKSLPGF